MPDKTVDKNFRLSLLKCQSTKEVREKLNLELAKYSHLFPVSKEAKIILKPNLNSYMNALTGNTTDLRILVTVIEFLKNRGYHNIIIAEGTSSGFYREKINNFSRLYIDKVAEFYGLKIVDLNYAASETIGFEYGAEAEIARITREADFFINLPKIKTHFETGISVCLKNMMGVLVGLSNKQKAHRSLAENILNINKYAKPHLHIIDGLIAMEGNGPSSGTPLNLGIIVLGTDPYLLDLFCARIAGFDYREIPYLRVAKERGIINKSYTDFIDAFVSESMLRRLRKPKVNAIVRFINNPKRQHYFIKVRLAPGLNRLFSTKLVGKLLNISGLRQDVFARAESNFHKIDIDYTRCDNCKKCADYCPMGLALPQQLNSADNRCIGCLYCFLVCPQKAIKIEGQIGFLSQQLKQYDKITRSIT
ncbi:MAG: DUF362 domain-containing protein [Candidatus Omnitrophica bacterium]|nr:DUF362 domain-containing protein [Candidatus Omnitrophota bacterium]MDD5591973.1 DUF362 domain-containing protein [Candidatus Omnitrophota bacterium]